MTRIPLESLQVINKLLPKVLEWDDETNQLTFPSKRRGSEILSKQNSLIKLKIDAITINREKVEELIDLQCEAGLTVEEFIIRLYQWVDDIVRDYGPLWTNKIISLSREGESNIYIVQMVSF